MYLRSPMKHMLSHAESLRQDVEDDQAESALLLAVVDGDTLLLEQTLPQIPDINFLVKSWTPLHYACVQGNYPIVRRLLAAGADPNGLTPPYDRTPLHMAVTALNYWQVPQIVQELVNAGADLEAREAFRGTALNCAAASNYRVLESLLQLGANPFALSYSSHGGGGYGGGFNALHVAADTNEYGAANMRLLLQQGLDINSVSKSGQTPLMLAAFQDYPSNVNFLLANGADKHLLDKRKLSALNYYHLDDRPRIAELLETPLPHAQYMQEREEHLYDD